MTHALHFLPQVDLILLLGQGSPAFLGTFQELRELEAKSDSTEASMVQLIQDGSQEKVAHLHHNGVTERDGVIMTVEEREYGKAGRDVWIEWGKNAGGWSFFISQTVFLCLDRGVYVASDWWIALWSQGWEDGVAVFGMEFPPQTDGNEAQVQYVCVYLAIITLSVLATLIRSLWSSVVDCGVCLNNDALISSSHSVCWSAMRNIHVSSHGRAGPPRTHVFLSNDTNGQNCESVHIRRRRNGC